MGNWASVSGGTLNTASQSWSAVHGGYGNTASGFYSSVGGGYQNVASGSRSTVSGGYTNTASGTYSTVSGGYTNTAGTSYATISGALPQYDSGWVNIGQGQAFGLTHNLGGDPNDYIVDVQFYSGGYERNHRRYGGDEDSDGDNVGAYWSNLDSTSIWLVRHSQDNAAQQIRVRIWVNSKP